MPPWGHDADRDREPAVALAREVDGRRGAARAQPRPARGRRGPHARRPARAQGRLAAADRPRGARAARLARRVPVQPRRRPRPRAARRTRSSPSRPASAYWRWGDPHLRSALEHDLGRPVRLERDLGGIPDVPGTVLVTVAGTLAALSRELGTDVDARRFRTNLHLELDAEPWAELGWAGATIELEGGVRLAVDGTVRALRDPHARPGHAREVARAAAAPRRRPRPGLRPAGPRARPRTGLRGRTGAHRDRLNSGFPESRR